VLALENGERPMGHSVCTSGPVGHCNGYLYCIQDI
jgi:hypothetical protein